MLERSSVPIIEGSFVKKQRSKKKKFLFTEVSFRNFYAGYDDITRTSEKQRLLPMKKWL